MAFPKSLSHRQKKRPAQAKNYKAHNFSQVLCNFPQVPCSFSPSQRTVD
jgi:hypothetical protein